MPGKTSLLIQNLCCIRGERNLFSLLNYELHAGQCLHLSGANGSGKTSLLRIICGLSQADSGSVQWGDKNLQQSQTFFSNSAYIGHKDALKNELTAIENLRFHQQLVETVSEQKLDDCLAQMQILECADLSAQKLSFGQRRRLSFAKLLLHNYSLWLLDEPFTGIDANGRILIEALCEHHLSNGGMIVLTHHQDLQNSSLAQYLRFLELGQAGEHYA
jgi:heme exporter protein A